MFDFNQTWSALLSLEIQVFVFLKGDKERMLRGNYFQFFNRFVASFDINQTWYPLLSLI